MGQLALSKREYRELRSYADGVSSLRQHQLKLAEDGLYDVRLLRLTREEKLAFLKRDQEREKEHALNDFFYFSKVVYGNRDLSDMHRELCDFATSPGDRKLILEPRGSLKSSVVTESYVLWRLVRNPNLRVLIDSEEYTKAKDFVKNIKSCIEQNEHFRHLFGRLDRNRNKVSSTWKWAEAAFTIADRTVFKKEQNVMCMGLDSTRTGYHYDLIIMDDIVSGKNTRTDAQLKKTIEHYREMLSILDPGCEMIVIGTRWHFADLYGYLISSDVEREKHGEKPRWKKLIRSARKADGSLLWPERLTNEFLREQRREQGVYMFSCQYLNDPTGGEDAIFKRDWLRFWQDLPETQLEFSVVMDPSLGKDKKSDYTAITVQARDYHGNRYVIRVMRGRWNPTKAISMLVFARQWVLNKYGIEPRVGLETVAFQWVLAHNLREQMRKGLIPRFRVHELVRTTTTTKHLQIERLVPLFEQGLIHLRGKSVEKCSPGAKLLVEEYLQFPYGKWDDILDTLAYHEELAKVPRIPQKERKTDNLLQKVLKDAKRRGRRVDGLLRVGSQIDGTRGQPWRTTTLPGG